MRRFLYLAALSVVATLAFPSVAMAQSTYAPSGSTVDCSGAEERDPLGIEYFFVPDAGGCIYEGAEGGPGLGPIAIDLDKWVWDAQTGERLGKAKDLDPDLSSGANSVTYQEFCGDFTGAPGFSLTAQEYFEQMANAQEQAILDPNGDGLACTADDEAFLAGDTGGQQYQYADAADGGDGGEAGQDDPCASAAASENLQEELRVIESHLQLHLGFIADVGGCAYLPNSPQELPIKVFNATAYDPDTGEELGIVKELDPDLTGGSNSTTYQEFCGVFPTAFDSGGVNEGTAQQYYDQVANALERAILDPDGDGVACTAEDEAFLSGDTGDDDGTGSQFGQTWTGQITQTGVDGTVTGEYGVEADIVPVSEMTGDLVGEVVGEVSYPELDCSGVWVLEEVNEGSVRVEERIEEGVGLCLEFLPITLTPLGDGSLEYSFENEANGDTGRGVLTLRGSSVPDGDVDSQQPSDVQQPAPEDGEESASEDVGEPAPVVNRTEDVTNYVAVSVSDFGAYCAGTVNDTVRDLRQGELPDTGGEWTVLLFSGTALVGGGWFLVRRFSR